MNGVCQRDQLTGNEIHSGELQKDSLNGLCSAFSSMLLFLETYITEIEASVTLVAHLFVIENDTFSIEMDLRL